MSARCSYSSTFKQFEVIRADDEFEQFRVAAEHLRDRVIPLYSFTRTQAKRSAFVRRQCQQPALADRKRVRVAGWLISRHWPITVALSPTSVATATGHR